MKSDGGLHVPGLCSEDVKSVEDVNQVGFNNEQSANIAELLFSRNFLYVGLFLIVSGLCLGEKHEYSNQRRNGVTSLFSYSSGHVNIHEAIHAMKYSIHLK